MNRFASFELVVLHDSLLGAFRERTLHEEISTGGNLQVTLLPLILIAIEDIDLRSPCQALTLTPFKNVRYPPIIPV